VDLRDIHAALTAVVGPAHLLTGPAAAAWAVDERVPHWVACPGTVEEVSGCLALATTHGLAVAPVGRGTRRHWGQTPRALDVALALHRLDRIVAHEPADLTVTVEAGVTLGQLDAALAPHRQFLPLDPPRADTSTLGGVIATAASGPYRARYGTIRDLLLGVTVVLASGTVVKGGGQVVKNVSGYDMPKLFVGALGTLGVLVSAHLRLYQRPASETTWLFGFRSAEGALDAALAVMDAPVVVSRLELFDEPTFAALGQAALPGAALALTVGSVPDGVRAQGARIAEVCGRTGGVAIPLPGGDERADAWWRRLVETWWPAGPDDVALRIGVRPTDTAKARQALEAAAGAGWRCRAAAEVMNGVLHATLREGAAADVAACVARVREALAPLSATCVVEAAPVAVKPALDVWGDVGPALEPMRRLKAELDPAGTLNAGRYVGGI
jgi:glycolate oxidase FAD binding subunit